LGLNLVYIWMQWIQCWLGFLLLMFLLMQSLWLRTQHTFASIRNSTQFPFSWSSVCQNVFATKVFARKVVVDRIVSPSWGHFVSFGWFQGNLKDGQKQFFIQFLGESFSMNVVTYSSLMIFFTFVCEEMENPWIIA